MTSADEQTRRRERAEQVAYWRMRLEGQSHNMAELLATRSFPGVRGTSSAFMKGTHAQDSGYDAMRYRAAAAQGVDTNGKRYLAGLARYPNDPEAWVSGLSDVRRVCEARGWNCEGAVDVSSYEADGSGELARDYEVADDIVEQRLAAELEPYDAGDRTPRRTEDLRDRAVSELSGRVDLDPEPRVAPYDDPFTRPGMEPDE